MPDTESEEFRKKLIMEQERLAKLWDAYQIQEEALKEATDEITKIETELELKDKEVSSLNEMVEKRDRTLREMEREITNLQKITAEYKPKLESCSESLGKEKKKLAQLYDVAQELDEELQIKSKALDQRDKWFMDNIKVFENMCQTIKERKEIAEARMLKEEMVQRMVGGTEPTDINRAGIITELTSIQPITDEIANVLYDAGFTSLEALKNARRYQLVAIDGVNATTANEIYQEMKKLG